MKTKKRRPARPVADTKAAPAAIVADPASPSTQADAGFPWGQGLLFFALAYCVGLGFRLVELPQWLDGDFRLDGQFLLATADAYHWLARAENIPYSELVSAGRSAVPDLLSLLALMFGTTPGKLAFWLPVALAPLAALPVCLVAARWRMPEAGLWAGVMTVVAPGYMQRTRLGFLDDDMLFIPASLLFIAGCVFLLTPCCRESWSSGSNGNASPSPRDAAVLLPAAAALGLWAGLSVWVYPKGFSLILAVAATATLAGLLLARPGFRLLLSGAYVVLFTAWFGPWWALPAVAILAAGIFFGFQRLAPKVSFSLPGPMIWAPVAALCLVAAAWLTRNAWLPGLEWTWKQVLVYYQTWAADDTRTSVFFGPVAELTKLTPYGTAQLLSGHWILAALAAAGFVLLLVKRPLAAMFLPLGAIALAAFFLPARFTLFSASFFGLGLGCGLVLTAKHFRISASWRLLTLTLLMPVVFWYPWLHARAVWPEPTVTSTMAGNLRELPRLAPEDALVWNRWDIGAATNYYSRRQAVEMSLANLGIYSRALAEEDKTTARTLILDRGADREHYVIVDWQGLAGMKNLLATGTFDRKTGQSAKAGTIQKLTGMFYFDLDRGVMIAPAQHIPLRTLVLIGQFDIQRHDWPNNAVDRHVVLIQDQGTGYMMDSQSYSTMYARLLLQPAVLLAPDFELALDDFPWMRVFRVKR